MVLSTDYGVAPIAFASAMLPIAFIVMSAIGVCSAIIYAIGFRAASNFGIATLLAPLLAFVV